MVGGQNEDIGSGHEPQDIVTLAEERESIPQVESTMSLANSTFRGPLPTAAMRIGSPLSARIRAVSRRTS